MKSNIHQKNCFFYFYTFPFFKVEALLTILLCLLDSIPNKYPPPMILLLLFEFTIFFSGGGISSNNFFKLICLLCFSLLWGICLVLLDWKLKGFPLNWKSLSNLFFNGSLISFSLFLSLSFSFSLFLSLSLSLFLILSLFLFVYLF